MRVLLFGKIIKKLQGSTLKRGVSTLEILIAFTILVLSMTAVIQVAFSNQSVSVDTQTNTEALSRAEALLEQTRAMAQQNFASVLQGTTVVTEQDGPMSYTKTLDVMDINSFTKQATSTVTWQLAGRTVGIVLSTLFTDLTSALSGNTCNSIVQGDWKHPQLLGSVDVGQNNEGTDVKVVSKKAYVTTNASSASKSDFYIVDVSNPTLSNLPILNVGGLNTGPGLAAVAVSGTYAYVANMSTVAQLQVIDISVPTAPVIVKSLDVTAAGDTAVGNSIFYFNKRIYLGLHKSSGPELYVIDVSDPTNLSANSVKATFETNTQINAITIKNGIAYLAVPDDPSTPGVAEQLRVLDVSNADLGSVNPLNTFYPNPSTMSGEEVSISKDGKTLYVGEGGPNSKPEFFSLDVTSPNSITQLQSKYIHSTVRSIIVRSNLAFLWTSDPNQGFQIWDLNNLTSATPYASLHMQQIAAGGFNCDGNLLYAVQKSQKALQNIGPGATTPN